MCRQARQQQQLQPSVRFLKSIRLVDNRDSANQRRHAGNEPKARARILSARILNATVVGWALPTAFSAEQSPCR